MITTLFQLVAQVESNNQSNAVRFEPGWVPSATGVAACIKAYSPAYMNQTTAKTLCAMSWGKVQIMGSNLYDLGLSVALFDYVKSDALQEQFFNKFCVSRKIAYTLAEVLDDGVKLRDFARKYNGAATVYGDKLIQAYIAGAK